MTLTPEIKSAYRRLIASCHPDTKRSELDKLSDPDVINEVDRIFTERAAKFNGAYSVLSDDELRADYDKTLGSKGR